MGKKNKVMSATEALIEEKFGWAQTERIMGNANRLFTELCADNRRESRAVKAHTVQKIYPVIAIYQAMQMAGISREKSLEFLDWSCSRQAQPQANFLRALLKIPGLYKKMPAMYAWMTRHSFGEKAGFQFRFYETGTDRCKFDMTKCLYCDICRANDCPELTACFCHTDDITSGSMHPRILWNRTKTMGEGGDCCDFDIIVQEKTKEPRQAEPL